MANSIFKSCLILFSICFSQMIYAQHNPVSWEGNSKQLLDGTYEIQVTATIQSGWYVYAQELESDMGPVPTSLEFENVEIIGKAVESGNRKEGMDKAFGMNVVKFLDNVTFTQKIVAPKSSKDIKCIVTYMTCNGEMCLPPKDVEVIIAL